MCLSLHLSLSDIIKSLLVLPQHRTYFPAIICTDKLEQFISLCSKCICRPQSGFLILRMSLSNIGKHLCAPDFVFFSNSVKSPRSRIFSCTNEFCEIKYTEWSFVLWRMLTSFTQKRVSFYIRFFLHSSYEIQNKIHSSTGSVEFDHDLLHIRAKLHFQLLSPLWNPIQVFSVKRWIFILRNSGCLNIWKENLCNKYAAAAELAS